MEKEKQKEQGKEKEAATEAGKPAKEGKKSSYKKKKGKKSVSSGIIYVMASFNNTIVTITDAQGNTVSWCSAGAKGFKGSRKSTPFAAQIAGEEAGRKALEHGVRTAIAFVKGPGGGREAALRAISGCGIRISKIQDVTPLPHNGCRPPKRRRV